jgi:hypothetical protein
MPIFCGTVILARTWPARTAGDASEFTQEHDTIDLLEMVVA